MASFDFVRDKLTEWNLSDLIQRFEGEDMCDVLCIVYCVHCVLIQLLIDLIKIIYVLLYIVLHSTKDFTSIVNMYV